MRVDILLAFAVMTFAFTGWTGPTTVLADGTEHSMAAGDSHSAVIASDGTVFTWGDNTDGQLGDGTQSARAVARRVPGLDGAIAVAAGSRHTLVLKSDGTVWAFGANDSGQLGDGTNTMRTSPVPVPALTNIIAIAAGGDHSLALQSDGTVWAWGANVSGQLGDGTNIQRNTAVEVTHLAGVTAIAAGRAHSLAVRSDGTVWSWGNDAAGQLGDDKLNSRNVPVQAKKLSAIDSVAAGASHSFAISRTGVLYAWGDNSSGQLGDGSTTQRKTAVAINTAMPVTQIGSAGVHSIALSSDGIVYCWGDNSFGQLGDGTTNERLIPTAVPGISGATAIAAGVNHSLAAQPDNSIFAWGANDSGQIGDRSFGSRSVPAPVAGLSGITQIATGDNFALALNMDGTVSGWGDNSFGQLGDGTTTSRLAPVVVAGLSNVSSIAAGGRHSLALKSDGTVWSWGRNSSGQLGDGTTNDHAIPVRAGALTDILAIAAGSNHSVALRSDSTLWAWGANDHGQLGFVGEKDRLSPSQVPAMKSVINAAAGGAFTVAVKSDGTVWSWGDNSSGQLGLGKTDAMKDKPSKLSGFDNISTVVAGQNDAFAIARDGLVYAWGDNDFGQLGDGTTTLRLSPVTINAFANPISLAGGADHSLFIKTDGTMMTWGGNYFGQLGDGTRAQRNLPGQVPNIADAIQADAGAYFSMALRADGTVLAWGNNDAGQLGDGTLGRRSVPVLVLAPPNVALTSPADGATFPAGAPVMLSASASNPAGQMLKVEYFDGATKIGEATVAPFDQTWTGASLGPHLLTAQATDEFGFVATSSGANVTIEDSDSDQNGLLDSWEQQYFGHIGVDPNGDDDGDGLTNLQEFQQGTDPTDYYNGQPAEIVIVSGDNQSGLPENFTSQPLMVEVSRGGQPLPNAPIQFAVESGGGSVAGSNSEMGEPSIPVRTAADGTAQAFYREPAAFGVASEIVASVVSSSVAGQVVFHSTSGEGLTVDPGSVTAVVNVGETATSQVAITNYSSQARQFDVALENNTLDNLSYSDSDQPGGPEFVWNDISATGTHMDQVSDADDGFEAFDISFDFPYFGQTYRTIYVSSNGFVTLGDGAIDYIGQHLPSPDAPANLIAPFQNDLNLAASGDVYWQDFGDRVVIQFNDAARYAGDGTATFQIVLNRDGTILFYYNQMDGTVDQATVGIQNATGTEGLTVAYMEPYLKSNLAVEITSATPWLTVDPLSGDLAPNESASISLHFTAPPGVSGSYNAIIHVNAGAQPEFEVDVPVTMNVNQGPHVTFVEPADGASYLLDESIQLTASAEDPEGIQKVEFYEGADKLGEVAQPPYTFTWDAPGGSHSVTAKAIDMLGATGVSQPLTVTKDTDTDNDGLGDEWEMSEFGSLDQDASGDYDADGLTNVQEYRAHLSPTNPDTDGDGLTDGEEINNYGTDPGNADSDGDGMGDGWEVHYGLDPKAKGGQGDADGDGLSDKLEFLYQTDPNDPDSDDDGVLDGQDGWAKDHDYSPPRLPDFHYAVIDLGPGKASALNNANNVVGQIPWLGFVFPQGFLWRQGTRTSLGQYLINDINDSGEIIGSIYSAGYIWYNYTAGPVLLTMPIDRDDYPDPNPDPDSAWYIDNPSEINDAGIIVGARVDTGSLLFGGTNISVFGINGSFTSIKGAGLSSINNAGDLVGFDDFGFAVLIEAGSIRHLLGSLPSPLNSGSGGFAINDVAEAPYLPDVVGYSYHAYPVPSISRACLWSRGKVIDLGELTAGADSYASGINNKKQIVGGENYPSDKAFLWQNQAIRDLNDWIREDSDVRLYWAHDINESGCIAASGYNAQDQSHAYLLVPAELLPDYNRDGKIDNLDRAAVTGDNPYRFWINDDNDFDETGGNDIPDQAFHNNEVDPYSGPDYQTSNDADSAGRVDGMRDLIDFFPLYLDLKQLIAVFPPGPNATYKLKHEDNALNFALTDLKPETSGDCLRKVSTSGALDNATALGSDGVQKITSAGVPLSTTWLNKIKDEGKGIILLEGRRATDKPLILEVTDDQGNKLTEVRLPLKISPVEQMYRHVNFLYVDDAEGGRETDTGEPPNYPDSLTNGKTFLFVHGFNVSADAARGWNAEIFKRMWWSGSNAKFVGTTWHGDETNETTIPDYHKNVDNAFATAEHLALVINNLGPNVTVAAHSLGNVVVSSAIHDWGATPANYFMIDAAVAVEAYDGAAPKESAMIHPDWIPYQSAADPDHPVVDRVFASGWYLNPAFAGGDARRTLTWRDRFSGVGTNTYNFYSSSEDVLRKHEGDPGLSDVVALALNGGRYAWALQEKLKGRQVSVVVGHIGSTYGGWQFTHNYFFDPVTVGTPSPEICEALSDLSLTTEPVFDPGFSLGGNPPIKEAKVIHPGAPDWIIDLTDPAKGSSTAQSHRNQLLAEMFPARTLPAGANAMLSLEDRNYDMSLLFRNGWPLDRGDNMDWEHSDCKVVAYTFVYPLFNAFVDRINQ
jgi:alpha-tubulin suppressor-like RCC1 family protein